MHSWLKHVNSYSRDIQKLPLLVLLDVFFRLIMVLFMCLLLKAQNKVVYSLYYCICAKFIMYFVPPDIKKHRQHRHKPNHTHVQTQRVYLCCCLRYVYRSIYVFSMSMWDSKKDLTIYYMITITIIQTITIALRYLQKWGPILPAALKNYIDYTFANIYMAYDTAYALVKHEHRVFQPQNTWIFHMCFTCASHDQMEMHLLHVSHAFTYVLLRGHLGYV